MAGNHFGERVDQDRERRRRDRERIRGILHERGVAAGSSVRERDRERERLPCPAKHDSFHRTRYDCSGLHRTEVLEISRIRREDICRVPCAGREVDPDNRVLDRHRISIRDSERERNGLSTRYRGRALDLYGDLIHRDRVAAKIKEDFELKPSSPYGASKAAADRLAYAYFNTYNLPIAIIRPFNTYGERHTYDVVPKFISLALSGKDITIYGNGEQSRDLMYVDDTVNGFLIMGCHEKAIGEAVNFGTGKDVKVIDLANKIVDIKIVLDNNKIKNYLFNRVSTKFNVINFIKTMSDKIKS